MNSLYNFLESNSIYIVMIILMIIWIGIFGYIWRLDKKVKKFEDKIF